MKGILTIMSMVFMLGACGGDDVVFIPDPTPRVDDNEARIALLEASQVVQNARLDALELANETAINTVNLISSILNSVNYGDLVAQLTIDLTGLIAGPAGTNGSDGEAGADGTNGSDGEAGADGTNGSDGAGALSIDDLKELIFGSEYCLISVENSGSGRDIATIDCGNDNVYTLLTGGLQ